MSRTTSYCPDCGYCEHGPCVDDCGEPGGYICMGRSAKRVRAEREARNIKERA
jgi:hypothetical protein